MPRCLGSDEEVKILKEFFPLFHGGQNHKDRDAEFLAEPEDEIGSVRPMESGAGKTMIPAKDRIDKEFESVFFLISRHNHENYNELGPESWVLGSGSWGGNSGI